MRLNEFIKKLRAPKVKSLVRFLLPYCIIKATIFPVTIFLFV